VYDACVKCVMAYGSETWLMRVNDMHHLGDMLIRWMCRETLKDGKTSDEIRNRLCMTQ
jgi:hypothetical protein